MTMATTTSTTTSRQALRVLVPLALVVSALVHLDVAQGPRYAAGEVTVAGLFVADAVAALLAGAWVLLRPSRPAWAFAAVVAVSSLLAVVVSTYVRIPGPGPLPVVYDPAWYGDKVVAALAAGLAAVGAAAGLLPSRDGAPSSRVR